MIARDEKIEAMMAVIKSVLTYFAFEPSKGRERLPRDWLAQSIMDQCHVAWLDFKEFTRRAAH